MFHPVGDVRLMKGVTELGRLLQPTPIIELEHSHLQLFTKLEFQGPVGSIKDRTAYWVLRRAVERGELEAGSMVIESSSGNFATVLATYCIRLGLTFVPVIDPNINASYETFLRRACARVERVEVRDDTGGFLKTRLRKIEELLDSVPGAHWTNQYANPDGMDAHYRLTGGEVVKQLDSVDYVFVAVSSGGTIAGLSRRLKEHNPGVKIIAVDAEGSVIFGGKPQCRHIPGLGASVVPPLIRHAQIDDVVRVRERDSAAGCHALLERHGIFAGGSSGSVYAAIEQYLPKLSTSSGRRPRVLFLCADRGTAYAGTVYDAQWCERLQ